MLEIVYFVLLVAAYERAEMSLVYPIARGMAPVFVLVIAVALGTPTTALQVGGVLLVAVGVLVVRGLRGAARWRDVALALSVAAAIAAYVVVDKEGVQHADPLTYGVLILGIPGIAAIAWVLVRGGTSRLRRAITPASAVGGIFSMAAYALVLFALVSAPAAPVAAVRETGVVIAALLGTFILKERSGRERILGSLIVVAGVGLVVLG